MKFQLSLLFVLAVLFVFPINSRAQTISTAPTLEVYTIPVVVTDQDHFLQKLSAKDFVLQENKIISPILNIQYDPEEEVDYALVLEASQSLPQSYLYMYNPWEEPLDDEFYLAYDVLSHLRIQDKAGLAICGNKLYVESDFQDPVVVINKLNELYNTFSIQGPADSYSATRSCISSLVENLKSYNKTHKLVIVLAGTGQDDWLLSPSPSTLFNQISQSGIQIDFIHSGYQSIMNESDSRIHYCAENSIDCTRKGISSFDDGTATQTYWTFAQHMGNEIAYTSGGDAEEMRNVGDADSIYDGLILYSQEMYRLTYDVPTGDNQFNKQYKIKISLSDDLKRSYKHYHVSAPKFRIKLKPKEDKK